MIPKRPLLMIFAVALTIFAVKHLGRRRRPPPPPEPPSPNALLLAGFPDRSPEQAAILLAIPSQQALAAARTFQTAGIPFCVTRDRAAALRHRFVFIPSDDRTMHFSLQGRQALGRFVSSGGTLILQAPAGNLLPELTGLAGVKAARTRRSLAFNPLADAGFRYLREAEESRIPLASTRTPEGIWSFGLIPSEDGGAVEIAGFPDTSEAAMLRRDLGGGTVYTIGVDLRDAVLRPQAGRSFEAERLASNGFEPAADVWPLIFRAWYERRMPAWLRLRCVPGEAKGILFISHDIGPGTSLGAVESFSAIERSRKASATYFVQTKYVLDAVDGPFFDTQLRVLLRRLRSGGHEVASLGVARCPDLEELPLGTGAETIKNYRPRIGKDGATHGGSILGELEVSKALLEEQLPGERIAGFRSGLFSFPEFLDAGLSRTGYAYDSSIAAATSLSHFPFTLLAGRTMSAETEVVELPMTFEDQGKARPRAPGPILDALRKIAAYEGSFVWLQSPFGKAGEEGLLRGVLEGLPPGVRIMTMRDGARYWLARSKTRFWFKPAGRDGLLLHLSLPGPEAEGLSLEASRSIKACRPAAGAKAQTLLGCSGRVLTLRKLGGARELEVAIELERPGGPPSSPAN